MRVHSDVPQHQGLGVIEPSHEDYWVFVTCSLIHCSNFLHCRTVATSSQTFDCISTLALPPVHQFSWAPGPWASCSFQLPWLRFLAHRRGVYTIPQCPSSVVVVRRRPSSSSSSVVNFWQDHGTFLNRLTQKVHTWCVGTPRQDLPSEWKSAQFDCWSAI